MRIEIRSCATVSILLLSLLSSCGKKDESPPAATPASQAAPPAAKPQPESAPVAPPAAPQAKEPEPAAAGIEKSLSGTIGGQPVVMQLSFQEDAASGRSTVKGSYFLESQSAANKVTVSGTFQDGSLVMEQSVQGTVTGSFELSNDSANKSVYLGSWKGQGRVLPVKLIAAQ